ncbi:nitrogenase-stabilizing/protective protein NifW [Amphritea pacifica]|uniref:nitrogenase-stabilizing/protective protein NifW n=1 Tax=Amphritea pacifica TaxID=2811233 RepID=UPI001966C3D8|nr:nitrogenase-stabilizing/protective protein NifW [Amphritea pacifica]MBN1006940.1 nitrogenase-stabilizing/protective protein NifW [Amphritea pacifica]
MSDMTFMDDLEELSSAEDFLEYFAIEFDRSVVQVNRLHIMQRFHDYLKDLPDADQVADIDGYKAAYKELLKQAYEDFVHSDALTEKVFRVFHMKGPQTTFVPLDQILE